MDDYRLIFSQNLQRYMTQLGLNQTEIAEKIQVNKSVVSSWINCTRYPRMNTIERLAVLFGIEKSDLTEKKNSNPTHTKGVRIPVLGTVKAGIPIEAVTDILDYEEIPVAMARTGDFFALQVSGISMTPRIHPGDVVIVRKQEDCDNGDVAIVLVNGDEATVKEIKKSAFGITLIGWNVAEYPPCFYTVDEVESLPVKIIGKVVELRGKL